MGTVVFIWSLQLGAVIFFALRDASLAAFLKRLKRAFLRPTVGMLAAGCIAFLYAGAQAAGQRDFAGVMLAIVSFVLELFWLAVSILTVLFRRQGSGPDLIFGSAKFADLEHARERGIIGSTGLRLGYLSGAMSGGGRVPLHYTGDRHGLTCAATRSGKGVSTLIPNLLARDGSVLVIDPKGENAAITADHRRTLGPVHVLDPWGISGQPVARFNPLDLLNADSPTLIEDATLIAGALVVHEDGGNAAHFSEQASDLVKCLLLYLVLTPGQTATLGALRAILTGADGELNKTVVSMARSRHAVVRAAAAQIVGKNDKEWLSIVSTAQRNTHFLDSPALQRNLAVSDFSFGDLKGDKPVSIYLVLPVDRLGTHNRWLRGIVALGISQIARTRVKPKRPVLFLLDEFAALGRMRIIEDAYGLMAGMGLQMHAIVQDLSQLQRVYGDGWQTFVANAGAIRVFGTRDLMTAE